MSDRVEWPAGRDKDAALVIRTDYDDEQAWAAVKAALMKTWGEEDDFEPYVHIVDDPAWTGITPAQVLSEASAHEERHHVAYLADYTSMREAPVTLLALSLLTRQDVRRLVPRGAVRDPRDEREPDDRQPRLRRFRGRGRGRPRGRLPRLCRLKRSVTPGPMRGRLNRGPRNPPRPGRRRSPRAGRRPSRYRSCRGVCHPPARGCTLPAGLRAGGV